MSSSPSIAQPLPRLRDRVKLAPMDTAGLPPTINPRKLYAQQSAWVDSAMAAMTLQEKVGQLLVAFTFSYYQSDENETYVKLSRLVKEGKLGGIIFSRGDVYEVAMLANRYQSQAKFPLLISADMEWGVSMRINRTTEFPSNMAVAATWNSRYAFEMGRTIGEEARALGIHQNYAPDVDLNNNPKNPIINTRAFSEDISLTNAMAAAFISGTQSAGVIATAKHFPGHGDTELDSHKDLPVLPFTRGRLDSLELQPFSSAIKHGVMSVMIGHLSIPAIDSVENLPATLSQKITTDILKKQLAFAGLVVTDAMMMDGLTKQYSTGDAAVKAVQAGNDVILMSPDYDTAHAAICLAVQRGLISRWRLDNSVRKILLTKEWLGLTKNRYVDLLKVSAKVGTKRNTILAQEIADKSVTMLRNAGNILPLVRRLPKKKLLSISITDSKSCDVGKSFYDSLNTRYNNLLQLRLNADSDEQDYDFALRAAEISEAVVVSCYVTVKSSTGKLGLD
ncbi:MAG: hypothetical protein IAF08_07370, partial [Rhizobacter sp.]|nr:hypothetical protein [Chlorobiales bacterium]